MKILLTVTAIALCAVGYAQPDTVLFTYLTANKFKITARPEGGLMFPDDKLPAMLDKRMHGKVLFVYGEGFSHNLAANGFIENMFVRHFTSRGLTYLFGEQARSWIVNDDFFYDNSSISARDFFPGYDSNSIRIIDELKEIYQRSHFQFRAVDFERKRTFKAAIDSLNIRLSAGMLARLALHLPFMKDTSYMAISSKKFVQFLNQQRVKFFEDSSEIKALVGQLFPSYKYLLTDPLPSEYADNRDRNMAQHVFMDIDFSSPNIYMQTCGIHHAKRKGYLLKKSMVGYLSDHAELNGKILTATIYCESCSAKANSYGTGDNDWQNFMKGETLLAFRKAAGEDEIVLFDLTNLPEKYRHIQTDYVDLLIFARNQNDN